MKFFWAALILSLLTALAYADEATLSSTAESETSDTESIEGMENDEETPKGVIFTDGVFHMMWNNYPLKKTLPFMNGIGGEVAAFAKPSSNTCVMRLSYVLNRSGADKLHLEKGKSYRFRGRRKNLLVLHGADGFYYAIRIKEIVPFLMEKLGSDRLLKWKNRRSKDVLDVPSEFVGQKGIIWFDGQMGTATGHIDLWDGEKEDCAKECFFSVARTVWLWRTALPEPEPPVPDVPMTPPTKPFKPGPILHLDPEDEHERVDLFDVDSVSGEETESDGEYYA